MNFEKDVEIPEHSHEAQWGVILDGEIELTIDGKKYIFKKGDTYFIPKGVKHSAKIKKGYKDLTLFNQKDRYKAKETTQPRALCGEIVKRQDAKKREFKGVSFDVLAVGEKSMITKMHYKAGDHVPFHSHPNEQSGYLQLEYPLLADL